ncbi:MAG: sulfotransferase, partial [Fimbriimonadia bacterium]|nr:sulfotransferase [Fimbriimonadia bacterium]
MRMPNFLIIGAAKSGTTALYFYIKQHPEVFMAKVKEPRFFAYEGGVPEWKGPLDAENNAWVITDKEVYTALFNDVSEEKVWGEASPIYLYSEPAPERIKNYAPDAKLVAILRHPIERAYSHYLHLIRDNREPLRDFGKALDLEPERMANGWEWSWHYT